MAHKFVPRKGLNRKDPPANDLPAKELPPPEPTLADPPGGDADMSMPEPVNETPSRDPQSRSAKDSILKKLPVKGMKRKSFVGAESPRRELKKERRPSGGVGGSWLGIAAACLLGVGLAIIGIGAFVSSQTPGYLTNQPITAPTRLDWTFVEGPRSLDKPMPAATTYDSIQQRFDIYAPPDYDPAKSYPVIIFISNEAKPNGWRAWQKACQSQGIIFAAPYKVGDDRPNWERARITLDVLDEIRRKFNTDPDRTYLVGIGGGAKIACRIGFALPENIGGVIAIGGGDLLREETWLQRRVLDRLNVAFVMGEKDSARPEQKELLVPLFEKLKGRARGWTIAQLGKGAMPAPQQMEEVLQWVEEGVPARRQYAEQFKASRILGKSAPSREEWAALLMSEAKDQRLPKPELTASGLAQLYGITQRWDGLPAASEAAQIWRDHNNQKVKPWAIEEAKEQLAYNLALAESLQAYLTSPLDPSEVAKHWERQEEWYQLAKRIWRNLAALGIADITQKANSSIAELDRVVASGGVNKK